MRPNDPRQYRPRDRAANIEAIIALASTESQEAFESTMDSIVGDFHPGLLHEADVAVANVPAESAEHYDRVGSALFLSALPRILRDRWDHLGLDEDDLDATVDQHRAFFGFVLENHPNPDSILGATTVERIRKRLAEPPPSNDALLAVWYEDERARFDDALGNLDDIEWVQAKLNAELYNAMLVATDHPLSRLDARHFLRQRGGSPPTVLAIDESDRVSIELAVGELDALGQEASVADLHHFHAACRAARDALKALDPSRLDQFRGQIGLGSGACGNCSMHYAATGLASFDPTCPGLFDDDGTTINLTLEGTTSTCPFCATTLRIHAPAMFYSPERNQIVYHVPAADDEDQADAIEAARPAIEDLRQGYAERVGADAAAEMDRATEDICFDMLDFLTTIQMGTSAKENHAYNLVGYGDGTGAIIDVTKGVTIELTAGEYAVMAAGS